MKLDMSIMKEHLRSFLAVFCALVLFLRAVELPSEKSLEGALFGSFLIWVAILDFHYGLIFDRSLLLMTAVGAALRLEAGTDILDMCGDVLAGGAPLLLLRTLSGGGVGGGDIKFAACLGLWLGWEKAALTLLLSFWLGGAAALYLLASGKKERGGSLAFGPFLSAGAMLSFLYGDAFLVLYRELAYG